MPDNLLLAILARILGWTGEWSRESVLHVFFYIVFISSVLVTASLCTAGWIIGLRAMMKGRKDESRKALLVLAVVNFIVVTIGLVAGFIAF